MQKRTAADPRRGHSSWSSLLLWLLGMGTSYTPEGFIHILLVIAVIAVLLRVIQGRNPLRG